MAASNFAPALACVLVHEGGKDDDPRDPGGRTAYGVTQARYNQFRRANNLPQRDVWDITPDERTAIYKAYYWDVIQGDLLPAGLDYCVFDGAVNSGPAQAAKWLQRAVNDMRRAMGDPPIAVDGLIGDGTIEAVKAIEDQDQLIGLIQKRRLAMLRNLKTWDVFGRGWGRRVAEVQAAAQAVARGSVEIKPGATWTAAAGKAMLSDAKPLPSPNKGAIASAAGTVMSASSALAPALEPAQGLSPTLDGVLHALIIIGAIAAAVGAAWAIYANRQAKARADALDIAIPEPVPVTA